MSRQRRKKFRRSEKVGGEKKIEPKNVNWRSQRREKIQKVELCESNSNGEKNAEQKRHREVSDRSTG